MKRRRTPTLAEIAAVRDLGIHKPLPELPSQGGTVSGSERFRALALPDADTFAGLSASLARPSPRLGRHQSPETRTASQTNPDPKDDSQ